MKRGTNSRGFTLIEILVVIGIIAALLGMLVPALSRTGRQSRQAACAANLKQVITAIQGYNQKSRGVMFNFNPDKTYIDYTQPGVQQQSILFCQEVDKPDEEILRKENEEGQIITDPKKMIKPGTARNPWKKERTVGSKIYYGTYGLNGFLYNRGNEYQGGKTLAFGSSNPIVKQYPKPWIPGLAAEQASRVPVVADANMPHGWPHHNDTYPDNLFRGNTDSRYGAHMGRFAINRHGDQINIAFADGSVDMVQIKGLWNRKWNQVFNTELERNDNIGE